MAEDGEYFLDMMSGQVIASPSGMLWSAIAIASLKPNLTEPTVLIATAIPSGKLCKVRVTDVSKPILNKRRSDSFFSELFPCCSSVAKKQLPIFLATITIVAPDRDVMSVWLRPISLTIL